MEKVIYEQETKKVSPTPYNYYTVEVGKSVCTGPSELEDLFLVF